MRDFDKEIRDAEAVVRDLKMEKELVEAMPKNQRLADALHAKTCRWNHEDGCGWHYESWKNIGTSRRAFLDKADAMLAEMTFEEAVKVLKFM